MCQSVLVPAVSLLFQTLANLSQTVSLFEQLHVSTPYAPSLPYPLNHRQPHLHEPWSTWFLHVPCVASHTMAFSSGLLRETVVEGVCRYCTLRKCCMYRHVLFCRAYSGRVSASPCQRPPLRDTLGTCSCTCKYSAVAATMPDVYACKGGHTAEQGFVEWPYTAAATASTQDCAGMPNSSLCEDIGSSKPSGTDEAC